MYLYHYSADIRNPIMTKAMSGFITKENVLKERLKAKNSRWPARAYCDHVSFFFEPIPAALLPTLFPSDHSAWAKGKVLYEHLVKVDSLPSIIPYDVVEASSTISAYDKFSLENNWVDDNPTLLLEWMLFEDKFMRRNGDRGNSLNVLKQKIVENQNQLVEKFTEGSKREDFIYNKYKYAACVPHLMIWPPSGMFEASTVNRIVMGNDKRTPINIKKVPNWVK